LTPAHEVLGRRTVAGYGIGDFAMNLYWGALSYFLLYWYTDVVGLPPAVAGFVFFAGTAWDALTDPTVGYVVGRNRSRWGRYRPFLLFGSVPLSLAFALLFWVPPLEDTALIVFLLAVHLLFRTAYTIVGVPYSALSARISRRSYDRTSLASARMIAATGGSLVISSAGFPLVRYLGGGDEQSGFFHLALLAGSIAVIFHLVCFSATREPPEGALAGSTPEGDYTLGNLWTIIRANTAFLYLLAMIPLFSAAAAVYQKSLVYYVKYGLMAHEAQHIVLFVHGIAALIATPLWAWVAHHRGRRMAWHWSTLLMAAAALLLFFTTPSGFGAFLAMMLPFSVAYAAMGVLFWSMLPDTIEYGQWKSGFRAESLFFGIASFAQKMSIGIAGWFLGSVLGAAGFVADASQPASAVTTMKAGMTLVPAALLALTLLIVMRYPLDTLLHTRIRAELFGEGETS
jgi:glycoside/pentoside/hexuronide:cation symporter, GPH family